MAKLAARDSQQLGEPTRWRMAKENDRVGTDNVGINVIHTWDWLDSRRRGCDIQELVKTFYRDGCFRQLATNDQRGWLRDTNQVPDEHGMPKKAINAEGHIITKQLFTYRNKEVPQAVVSNSGYEIIRRILRIAPTIFAFRISIRGATVDIKEFHAGPGLGTASYETRIVLPPPSGSKPRWR
ncbi:MAG: hypothetical protein V3T84_06350 [Phycisphaerales bacterium]